MVQLSHSYMTTDKTIALTIRTFIDKVLSLFFNMLSRFVIAFLPRSKCLNFMVAVNVRSDFGAQENKLVPFSLFSLEELESIRIMHMWRHQRSPSEKPSGEKGKQRGDGER